jgi:ParD-like antitoxin of type II bacterial toxin-antitoxin system
MPRMPRSQITPIGVMTSFVSSPAAPDARQSRSAKQQLDHWARVGRAASSRHSAGRRKMEVALAGELALAELSEEEGVVFNAQISAAIQESLADADYGQVLAGRGITTVALDEDGQIGRHLGRGDGPLRRTQAQGRINAPATP